MKKIVLFAVCLAALPAGAHPGHADGFAAGFTHPFGGLDHLLAMLAVGMWSRHQRHGAVLPLVFLAMMANGAAAGLQVPALEAWIAASVVLFGVLAAATLRMRPVASVTLVALCAFLHGAAHGRELPGAASSAGYLLASALLLAAGWFALARRDRMAGAAIGAAGLCLLAGVAV